MWGIRKGDSEELETFAVQELGVGRGKDLR